MHTHERVRRRWTAALLLALLGCLGLFLAGAATAQDHTGTAQEEAGQITGQEGVPGGLTQLPGEDEPAEDEEHADPTSLVLPEPGEMIPAIAAFLVFFLIMAKIAFPGLRKALADRESAIKGELEKAERARLESEEAAEQYKRQMAESRAQADKVVKDAAAAAEEVRRDIVTRAEEEARGIVEKVRAEAGLERDRVLSELRREVAGLSLEGARRVVQKELADPEAQRQLVEQFIASVGGRN